MREKAYIIIGKKPDGEYLGYVEYSFSMGYEAKWVKLWRLHKHFNISDLQKMSRSTCKEHPKIQWVLYRVGSKNCPVKINWAYYHLEGKYKKFTRRNLHFCKK